MHWEHWQQLQPVPFVDDNDFITVVGSYDGRIILVGTNAGRIFRIDPTAGDQSLMGSRNNAPVTRIVVDASAPPSIKSFACAANTVLQLVGGSTLGPGGGWNVLGPVDPAGDVLFDIAVDWSINPRRLFAATDKRVLKLRGGAPILNRGSKTIVLLSGCHHLGSSFAAQPYIEAELQDALLGLHLCQTAGRSRRPAGASPVVTSRHSAMRSLRASATIMVLRAPPRRRQAPLHWRDVVRRRGDFSGRSFGLPKYRAPGACSPGPPTWTDAVVIFPGEVLAFQNIERQAHALGAPAPGGVVKDPPAEPDLGEDDFEGVE
jgi:hypothetical protein